MSAAVFLNPAAGGGRAGRRVHEVRGAFARRNYSATIFESRSADEFRRAIGAAKNQGYQTLVAMGGDGSLQMLVRQVIGERCKIGVIPAGGGNDFAAALGIPKNLETAVEILTKGKIREVDIVRVRFGNGEEACYLGGGGMGLDAAAVSLANGRFLNWPGRLRYLASAILALRGFQGIELTAEFPESEPGKVSKRVLLAAALNTPTLGGGLRLAPEARIDDGMLEVVLLEMLSTREVLALIPRLLATGELRTRQIKRYRAARIKLSAEAAPWFQGDGELLGRAPVEIAVVPRALRMLVP